MELFGHKAHYSKTNIIPEPLAYFTAFLVHCVPATCSVSLPHQHKLLLTASSRHCYRRRRSLPQQLLETDGQGRRGGSACWAVPDTLESLNSELFSIWADVCCRLEKHECGQCYLCFNYFEQIHSIPSFIEHLLSLRHYARGQWWYGESQTKILSLFHTKGWDSGLWYIKSERDLRCHRLQLLP